MDYQKLPGDISEAKPPSEKEATSYHKMTATGNTGVMKDASPSSFDEEPVRLGGPKTAVEAQVTTSAWSPVKHT